MVKTDQYAEVAVSGPLIGSFTYRIPPDIVKLQPGQRLLVPFGKVKKVGFYLGPSQPQAGMKIKNIIRPLDEESFFSKVDFEFCRWLADYYFANPADCFAAALPSVFKTQKSARYVWNKTRPEFVPPSIGNQARAGKKLSEASLRKIKKLGLFSQLVKKGIISQDWPVEQKINRKRIQGYRVTDPDTWLKYYYGKKFYPEIFDGHKAKDELRQYGWNDYQFRKAVSSGLLSPVYSDSLTSILDFIQPKTDVEKIEPNPEQKEVLATLSRIVSNGFSTTLLHGVTGSGKTLVYCHICREMLEKDKTVLVLTPEITLAGTTLSYFRGFFGDKVTIIHSALTERERHESWQGIRQGRYRVVVGPRSAIFAPLPNPGMIIVDEEHDGSYKQDNPSPRFHGRDAAIMKGKICNIPVLLGSASPSLESYYRAKLGQYRLLTLIDRPTGASLPSVKTIDMRSERLRGDLQFMSFPLKKGITKRLADKEQVILYLNRRGYSPLLKCAECGHVPTCSNCRVKLTYHSSGQKLSCHYCGYVNRAYDFCEKCGGNEFLYPGVGTQKIEEKLPRLFDKAAIARLDSDSAGGRKKAYEILEDFAQGKSNLLLGTQMVTKGLDLPEVTLVGVISADMSLDLPDFRASEKAFAKLLQVAGRSGRSKKRGEVLIQTFCPDDDIIRFAQTQDYVSFYEKEIVSREALAYPPFSRIVNFAFSSSDEKNFSEYLVKFKNEFSKRCRENRVQLKLLGPAPCPFYFLKGRYRRHMFVKTRQVVKLTGMLRDWERSSSHFGLPASIKVVVDVDPDDMF